MSTEPLGIDEPSDDIEEHIEEESGDQTEQQSAPAPEVFAPPVFHPMRFVDVVMVLPSTHPVMILEETDPPHRQLRIPIGAPEGIAIAYAARGVKTPKPLTHELFVQVLATFGVTIETVRITSVEVSAYFAELVLSSPAGPRVLRCRPSDAVALALRQGLVAPITAAAGVLDQVGLTASGPS